MEIAILGYRRSQREEVAARIRQCLEKNSPCAIRLYSLDEPRHNPAPKGLTAAFAITDGGASLKAVQRLADWGKDLPVVFVGTDPDCAPEVMLNVKRSLAYPPDLRDMSEALLSVGLAAADDGASIGLWPPPETKAGKQQIAIFGARRVRREELEKQLRSCLGEESPCVIRQYGLDEPVYNPPPEGLKAAFVMVEDPLALNGLRTVAGWSGDLPVVIVSDDPRYALDGIRLKARYYILLPLVEKDVREALARMEVR